MLKTLWTGLSLREKKLIFNGFLFLTPILFYFFILEPLNSNISLLKQEVTLDQKNYNWIKKASLEAIKFPNAFLNTEQKATNQNLSSLIDISLNEKNLKQYIVNISNAALITETIQFKAAPFDDLIDWLTLLWQKYQIKVSELQTIQNQQAGFVDMKVVLVTS